MALDGLRRRRFTDKFNIVGKISTSFSSYEEESVTTTTTTTTKKIPLLRLWILTFMAIIIGCLVVILVGAEVERLHIDTYKTSLESYTKDDRVCCAVAGDDDDESVVVFETFSHASKVPTTTTSHHIAHCGACGSCSTMHDMEINAKTTRTLTDNAAWCTKKGFLQSFFLLRGIEYYNNVARECLEKTVGFTPFCQKCWLDDMECSIKNCIFTCLKSVYLLRQAKNLKDGSLNKCLECDEKVCGPAFLQCAGANRRRQGIHSDIKREDDEELCRLAQMDWSDRE